MPPALLETVVADADRLGASIAAARAASTRVAPAVDRLLTELAAAVRRADRLRPGEPLPPGPHGPYGPVSTRQRAISDALRSAMRAVDLTEDDVARALGQQLVTTRQMLGPAGTVPRKHIPRLSALLGLPPAAFVNELARARPVGRAPRGAGRANHALRSTRPSPAVPPREPAPPPHPGA